MKSTLYIIAFVLLQSYTFGQNALNMHVIGQFQVKYATRVDSSGSIWNDITGWFDATKNREYIIAGTSDSIYFVDISQAPDLKLCARKSGIVYGAVNRDYETYSHYVYCVADQGNAKLQIFDLQYLPDSVHLVYESDSLGTNTHSLFIEAKSKRLYRCSNKFTHPNAFYSAMDIFSLENPEMPKFLAHLQVPNDISGNPIFKAVHETYVRNDTAYCSCEYAGQFIFDLRNPQQQQLISSISNYPNKGYCHTSWLNTKGNYLAFTDEVPNGLPAKLYDIQDIFNPRLLCQFNSNVKATPHNIFWKGDYIYTSNYQDGVYVWQINNEGKEVIPFAFYDTYPNRDSTYSEKYTGCWGVYPYLPSGKIIASDRRNGLFVLGFDSLPLNINEYNSPKFDLNLYPNPANEELHWECNLNVNELVVHDLQGNELWHSHFSMSKKGMVNISGMAPGIYYLTFIFKHQNIHQKIIKTE